MFENNSEHFLSAVFYRFFVGVTGHFWNVWRFIRIVESGNVNDFSQSSSFVESLGVSLFAHSQRRVNMNFNEASYSPTQFITCSAIR